jgi:signal transduction histidine kinase/DNA-binding response OmpR family regulator
MSFTRLILVIVCLASGFALSAQNTDSLVHVLRNTRDAGRSALLLNSIAQNWHDKRNEDSAICYAAKANELSQKVKNDTITIRLQCLLGDAFRHKGANDAALAHYDVALQLAYKRNKPADEMETQIRVAFAIKNMGKHYLCLDHFNQALQIALQLHDKEREAFLYKVMAAEYAVWDDYGPVLDLIRRSIHIYDSLKQPVKAADNYMELGIMYCKQKKLNEALRAYYVVDSIYRVNGDSTRVYDNTINIGVTYKNMGDYDDAIRIYKSYLAHLGEKDFFEHMVAYHNLAVALAAKGEYFRAKRTFLAGATINREIIKDPSFDIVNFKEMAVAAYRVKRLDTALRYALWAEQIGQAIDQRSEDYRQAVELLADVYDAKGDMARAHYYDRKYIALQDTLHQRRYDQAMAEAATRFNLSEKNKQVALLSKQNELQKVKSQRLKIEISLLFIALMFGSFTAVIIVRNYRRTLIKNKLLSEQKQLIDHQVAELALAASNKARFFANISHELRTPVTLLSGMLGLLKQRQVGDARDRQTMEVAYNNSLRLQQMIEEILDLSRHQTKKEDKLHMQVKEAALLLRRTISAFETYVVQQGQQLTYNDEAIKGAFIAIDDARFEQIINNLVYNAVKFNAPGAAIEIIAAFTRDKQHVSISISNRGKGISPQDLPHIFDRYYQAPSSARAQGLGIGLSLVKDFTTALGGSIVATSEVGAITTFTLSFPVIGRDMVEDIVPEETIEVNDWTAPPGLSTVLLVEDNAEMRFYIKEVLGNSLNIIEAEDGLAALAVMAPLTPDLIISDMMMPGMDGRAFVTRLKEEDNFRNIPIVMLTALADSENRMGMLRIGVDDYIVKPFNAEELKARVYNLLQNNIERRAFATEPTEPGDISPGTEEADEFRAKLTASVVARLKYNNISVADIAFDLAVSERQLFRLAKALTGCSPAQLIKEVRLQTAYDLLIKGEVYKIEDLARRVGFDNSSYFSRQFLARFGKRPSEYL